MQSQPRLDDVESGPGVNLNGSTITVTPASAYNIYCYTSGYTKDWYKVEGTNVASIIPRPERNNYNSDVYATNAGSGSLTLHFRSFQSTDIGEYECRFTQIDKLSSTTTLSVYLSECWMLNSCPAILCTVVPLQ